MDWLILYLMIGFVVSTITYRIDQMEATFVDPPYVMIVGIILWPIFYAMILHGLIMDWNEYKKES